MKSVYKVSTIHFVLNKNKVFKNFFESVKYYSKKIDSTIPVYLCIKNKKSKLIAVLYKKRFKLFGGNENLETLNKVNNYIKNDLHFCTNNVVSIEME